MATVAARRKAALDQVADSILAEEDRLEDARKDAEAAAAAAARKRQKMLEQARKAEAVYAKHARGFEESGREMVGHLRGMLEASADMLHLPSSTSVVSKSSILTRASRALAAWLFEVCRTGDWCGALRLHYSGRPRSD